MCLNKCEYLSKYVSKHKKQGFLDISTTICQEIPENLTQTSELVNNFTCRQAKLTPCFRVKVYSPGDTHKRKSGSYASSYEHSCSPGFGFHLVCETKQDSANNRCCSRGSHIANFLLHRFASQEQMTLSESLQFNYFFLFTLRYKPMTN